MTNLEYSQIRAALIPEALRRMGTIPPCEVSLFAQIWNKAFLGAMDDLCLDLGLIDGLMYHYLKTKHEDDPC